jgi:hypothetical protein
VPCCIPWSTGVSGNALLLECPLLHIQ